MSAGERVRLAAELAVGDVVRTPRALMARVCGHTEDRVLLCYCDADGVVTDDQDGLALQASLLRIVRRAAPADLPRGFFGRGRG
jgi:hypothetical protein